MARSKPTVRDIARVAGVSAASVSRAINAPDTVSGDIRDRVQRAIEQIRIGGNGNGRTDVPAIGCLFADHTTGPRFTGFDATIWSGIARVAIDHGAEVHLLNIDRREPGETIRHMCDSRGIGALAVRVDTESDRLVEEIAASDVPAVLVAHTSPFDSLGSVIVRSREASRDAVAHLIALGHERIAFCRNLVPDQDHADRQAGYRDALAEHGLSPDESLELNIPADADGGVTAINRLLAMPKPPTAVYFADPLPTLGALRRLRELDIDVPTDFSVIGFDDDNARTLGSPIYSAVCQDAPRLARVAGQLLYRVMMNRGDGSAPPRVELDSYFEVNSTTAPPPAGRVRPITSASRPGSRDGRP
ncbi:MAG: LacI family DNA-binding transcriptional regulator [Planctomycetota bacterium]